MRIAGICCVVAALCCSICCQAGLQTETVSHSRVRRIAGGEGRVTKAEKADIFKSAVSLLIYSSFGTAREPYFGHCGASILNEHLLITAAHCLADKDGRLFQDSVTAIRMFGLRSEPTRRAKLRDWLSSKLNPSWDSMSLTRTHAVKLDEVVHQNFSVRDDGMRNDIGLMLVTELPLSNNTQHGSVQLPPPDVVASKGPLPGEICHFAGWGSRRTGGEASRFLMKAKFTIVPAERCKLAFPVSSIEEEEAYENKLCALANDTALRRGDAGGGLICESPDGNYLGGVASGGQISGESLQLPIVFVRVSAYVKWISGMSEILMRDVQRGVVTYG